MEPAIRIERTTCGLRISDSPTSDNLTPQQTTKQDAPDMGTDGDDFKIGGDVMGTAKVEHLLGLVDAANGRAG